MARRRWKGPGSQQVPRGQKSEVRARGTLEPRLNEIGENVQTALEKSMEEVLVGAQENCPVDSEELRDSLYISKVEERGPDKWRIELIAPKPYAAAQERGSGLRAEPLPGVIIAPIPILPKKGKVLVFYWQGGPVGLFKYRKTYTAHLPYVIHPGVPPTRFMRDALKKSTTNVWTRILKASSGQGV